MSSRASRALVWMVVAVLWASGPRLPASARSAIRDENGVLTLSDKPLGEGAQTYAVRGASSTVRATRGSGEGVRSSQWDDVIEFRAREQESAPISCGPSSRSNPPSTRAPARTRARWA